MRLIDAEEFLHSMCCLDIETQCDAEDCIRYKERKYIEASPTIEAEPVNRWISVEDALPDTLQNVLVCTDINTITIAWINGEGWTFADTGNGHTENWSFADVKYWMPLPEPPKKMESDCRER